MCADRLIALGEIVGVHGIRGWVKVFSHTEPRERILDYGPWLLDAGVDGGREAAVLEGARHGRGVIARLQGCDDPERARALIGATISVPRDRLPPPAEGEYYWADLEGLRVVNEAGVELGTVKTLFRTGANDVMVVAGERDRLVPFVQGRYVLDVDFAAGVIRVDWDETF